MVKDNRVVANTKVVYVTFIDGSRFVVNVTGRDFTVNAIGEEVTIGPLIHYLTKTPQSEQ